MIILNDQFSETLSDQAVPEPGEQMASEIQDADGNVLYRAVYDLAQAPTPDGVQGIALKTVNKKEEWPDSTFAAIQSNTDTIQTQPLEGKGETAVAALKLAWDIIKSSRPITDLQQASTAILNPDNTNPFDYAEAKKGQTSSYYWWGYNYPFKKWKSFEVWIEVAGTYDAKAPKGLAPGHYVPSLYINFPKNPWTMFGFQMQGSAQITPPSNIGPRNDVNVYSELISTINVTSLVDNLSQNFRFSVDGKSGFKKGR